MDDLSEAQRMTAALLHSDTASRRLSEALK